VRQLKRMGVQRIFGLPGEDHLRLLDAIEAEGLQYIGAHDETAAAIMACAEADTSGLPGVLLVTHAPGITNAVNGIANAYLDGLPLVVISGQHAANRYALTIRQTLDNHLLLRAVTKWTATASASIHQLLARVVSTALASPRGPVFLELREEVAAQKPLDLAEDWPIASRRPLRGAQPDDIGTLCRTLSEAQRPVILVGGSDYAVEERGALMDWARTMACPVFTSPSALGLLPESFEWFGGAFLNGLLERPLLDRTDLLVNVNLNANDFFNARWPYAAPVVAIRREPDTERFVARAREVIGDAGPVFRELLSSGPTSRSKWVPADVLAYGARIRAELASPADRLTVVSALEVASAILPDDTLVAVDAGFGKPITSYLWRPAAPRSYFASHGLSTMGYAIPAANALKLAHPRRTVLGLLGDGSLLMRATEIRTAVELGIAPIYLVWMDGSLTQIEMKQRLAGLRTVGAEISAPACAELAQALGARGADVRTLDELRSALAAAVDSRLPTLIGAHIDTSRHADWYSLIRA